MGETWAEMLDGAKDGKEFGDILMRMCAKVEEELQDDDLAVSEVDDDA
jgi:hypothetical protein